MKLKNNKRRGQLCTLVVRREKIKKNKTKMSINDNPTIISLDAPHHVEEGMAAHLERWWMAIFGHRTASHAPLKWHGRRPLVGACGACADSFSIKK